MTDWRPEAAEAVGTFVLMVVGGAAIMTAQTGPLVALAFGGAVMVMVYAVGHVSGAHFNPAITLGFAVTRHFPWRRVPSYLLAQLLGAAAACLLLRQLGPVGDLVATGSQVGAAAFVIEVLATALLAFVIVAVATDPRAAPGLAGVAIGSTVFLGALVAGPLSGAAMNPARALVPALMAGQFGSLLATAAGPFVGGILGMGLYQAIRRGGKPKSRPALAANATTRDSMEHTMEETQ